MKLAAAIPGFFWHYLSKLALQEGWNMEDDMLASLENIKDEAAFSSKIEKPEVLVSDLMAASKGIYTDSFIKFCKESYTYILITEFEKPIELTTPLLISMHSGSSDYFTWGMLKDFVENLND